MKLWKRLTEPLASYLHRRALRAWMEELNEKYGHPSEEDIAWAREVMEEARGKRTNETGSA